jgi:hypothetical protein
MFLASAPELTRRPHILVAVDQPGLYLSSRMARIAAGAASGLTALAGVIIIVVRVGSGVCPSSRLYFFCLCLRGNKSTNFGVASFFFFRGVSFLDYLCYLQFLFYMDWRLILIEAFALRQGYFLEPTPRVSISLHLRRRHIAYYEFLLFLSDVRGA